MPVNVDIDCPDMLCDDLHFAQSTINSDTETRSCLSSRLDSASDTEQRDWQDAPPPIATRTHYNPEESLQSALM